MSATRPRIGVVTNPNSGKNRRRHRDDAAARVRQLQAAGGGAAIVRQTESLDALHDVVAELLDAGCDYWVCDGGDGSLHWLLAAGLEIGREREGLSPGDPRLPKLPAIVPANGGSIDFIAHKAGVRGDAPALVAALAGHLARGQVPAHVELDTFRFVARVERPLPGQPAVLDRLGFATAIGGVAQRFFEKLYALRPVEPSKIARVLGNAVGSLAAGHTPILHRVLPESFRSYAEQIFAPTLARVEVDGRALPYESFASLQIGAIDINLGGVVRTFRHAAAPGVMHAQAISMSALGVTANLPNIVLGTRIWGKNVFDAPARRLRVVALGNELLDPVVDGEMFFGLSEIEITPGPTLLVPRLRADGRVAA